MIRFGPIRTEPPAAVIQRLGASGTGWTAERLGGDGDYPNGGMWLFADPDGRRVVVKRTGPEHLGANPVWGGRTDPADPHWWGREATFYASTLATSGWPDSVRAASCHAVDDHDGGRDLWLEYATFPATSLAACERAVRGLAAWQVANDDADLPWLSQDWIPNHLARHALDNQRTLNHPGWRRAIERGIDPALRDAVANRITDPDEARGILADLPQALTHFDFHLHNLGSLNDELLIIDWAFVGHGPIGHDVGMLAADGTVPLGVPIGEIWEALTTAYQDALKAAGWVGDLDLVRHSMAVSTTIRLGFFLDHVLDSIDRTPDDKLRPAAEGLRFFLLG